MKDWAAASWRSDRGLEAPGPDLQDHGSRDARSGSPRRDAAQRRCLETAGVGERWVQKKKGGKEKWNLHPTHPCSFLPSVFSVFSPVSLPPTLVSAAAAISAKSLRGNAPKARSVISDADVRAAASLLWWKKKFDGETWMPPLPSLNKLITYKHHLIMSKHTCMSRWEGYLNKQTINLFV